MHRCPSTRASCCAGASKPCGTGCTGGTKLMHRCKHPATYQRACQVAEEKIFSTGYTGRHRSKAPVQCRDSCKGEKQHRLNRRQGTGLTGDSHVSCQKANGYGRAVSDRLHWCPITSLSGALRRKSPMALNGSMVLEAYIYM